MSRNPRPTSAASRGRQCEDAGSAYPSGRGMPANRGLPNLTKVKTSIPKRGPPPASPKKLDYKRPGMTRAMAQRLEHTKRLQEQMERKEQERVEATANRKPKRCAAPPGGDARMFRARPAPPQEKRACSREPAKKCAAPPKAPKCAESKAAPECPKIAVAKSSCKGAIPKTKPPSALKRRKGQIPDHMIDLAESMNADIVEAEPLVDGPVDGLIIPPGVVKPGKTTVVSIPVNENLPSSTLAHHTSHNSANRSMQIIKDSLDEQDAVECEVVNNRLHDLQHARRDFVMAVANVGNNAVHLLDDDEYKAIMDVSPPNLSSSSIEIREVDQYPELEAARKYIAQYRADQIFGDLEGYESPIEDDNNLYLDTCEPGRRLGPALKIPSRPRYCEQVMQDPQLAVQLLQQFLQPEEPCPRSPQVQNVEAEFYDEEIRDVFDPWGHPEDKELRKKRAVEAVREARDAAAAAATSAAAAKSQAESAAQAQIAAEAEIQFAAQIAAKAMVEAEAAVQAEAEVFDTEISYNESSCELDSLHKAVREIVEELEAKKLASVHAEFDRRHGRC